MSKLSRAAKASVLAACAATTLGIQPSSALEYNFGDVQVFLDTTVSAGVSMRVADRNMNFVAGGNGGPTKSLADVQTPDGVRSHFTVVAGAPAVFTPGAATGVTGFSPGGGQAVTYDYANLNAIGGFTSEAFAGSINSDDSRLNFDSGDLTSGVVKMTNDIQANYENYTFFARINSFYDAVLDSSSSYERSGITDGARVDAARDIDLLDFYVSGDFNVGDLPLNVRLGKQVVNWGEATFILNGISSWNPFDVNAFRRPGSEIKEGLLPVWGAYASLGLPYDMSLEAFYQLEWEEVSLDRPGTPFSTSDVARVGSAWGGSFGAKSFVTSGPDGAGFLNRNCSTPDALTAGFDTAYTTAGLTNFVCGGTNAFLDYTADLPIGQSEAFRLALNGGTGDLARDNDRDAKDSGQYGLALRWYAEELNSTEFGFYFMNYHSRLPMASQRFINTGNSVFRTFNLVGDNVGTSTRQTALGCGAGGLLSSATVPLNPAKYTYMNNTIVNDTYGVFAAAETAVGGDAKALATAGIIAAAGGAVNDNSLLETAILNCALAWNQVDTGAGLLTDGTEIIAPGNPVGGAESLGLYLEYPEDIKLYGMSFNTTIGDWGVQGEVAYRDDQPLQLDTDQITIATLGATCLFDAMLSPTVMTGAVDQLQTMGGGVCGTVPVGQTRDYQGFVREEVVTFDVGTTATYTNSNPAVNSLGADLGILLTEVGAMWVPDVPAEGDFSTSQLGNVCTSGTDLPMKGFLGLSSRSGCRPTEFSYGYVLVGILQYNNAFGTPWTLSPRIAWQHDVKGNSPAPLGNYREGTKSVSLAVDATLQRTWKAGLSYTKFFGNEQYTKYGDKDFFSVNLS
ncbi:MAG: DUF1302 domain-containing protein, partial [Kangiella sp.]|nr:DUF1302 domain-containing protein [Kangiella sp.]